MKDGNALILSAGRRVGLVRAFQSKIECLALRSKVFCTDLKPSYSAACLVADGFFIVPRCDDEEFIPTLLRICNENHVRIVVPTIDPELAILSACRELFRVQGVDIIVSDFDFVQQCDDKRNLPQLANFLGLGTPRIFDAHELEYPCFCKPFNGSSGKAHFRFYQLQI